MFVEQFKANRCMKKLMSFLLLAFAALQFILAGDVVTRNVRQLPLNARSFLVQHFPDAKISYVKTENNFLKGKEYETILTDGSEVKFDKKGEWEKVDCNRLQVPAAILPEVIRQHVRSNHANHFVTQIERGGKGYEVELNNYLTLIFDKKGKFIRFEN